MSTPLSHDVSEQVVRSVHEMGYDYHTAERLTHLQFEQRMAEMIRVYEQQMAKMNAVITEVQAANRLADQAETNIVYTMFSAALVNCFTRLASRALCLPDRVTFFWVASLTYKLSEDDTIYTAPASDASAQLHDSVLALSPSLAAFDGANWDLVKGRNEARNPLDRGLFSSHDAVDMFLTKADQIRLPHVNHVRTVYALLRQLNLGLRPEDIMVGANFYD